jgi:DNA anti-recombination protein RmuC
LRIETSTPTIKDARTIGTSQGEKMDWNRANEASEQLVEATWETYRMLANYTLSLQQRNARFVQKMIDGSIKELRRQVEHNRTITDGLLELAERRREAFRELVEASVSGGYTNFFFAPFTPLLLPGGDEIHGV